MQGLAPNIGEAADQIGLRHRGAFGLRHPIFGDDAQRLGGVGDIHREFAAGLGEVGGAHRRRHHAASLIDQLGQILGGGVEFSRGRGFGRLGLATEAFTLRRARRLPDDEFPGGRDGRRRLDLDRGRDGRRRLDLDRGRDGRRRLDLDRGRDGGGASTWTAGATEGGASTWTADATGGCASTWTAGVGAAASRGGARGALGACFWLLLLLFLALRLLFILPR